MAEVRGGLHYPRSIGEFQAWFRTDADCLDYLEWLRWPHGFECAKCGSVGGWRLGDRRIMCAGCGHRTSVTAGTIFDKTRTPLTVWFTACWSFATAKDGISALSLQRSLEIGFYQTAWAMLARFRSVLVHPRRERLNGTVEVDETYIGGEEPGLAGGRAQGKKVLTGIAVEVREPKGIGRCRMALLEDGSAASLLPFVTDHIDPAATVITDAWMGYHGLARLGYTPSAAPASGLRELRGEDSPGTSNGRPHLCRLPRAGIRRAWTESPPGALGALRIGHTPAKWRARTPFTRPKSMRVAPVRSGADVVQTLGKITLRGKTPSVFLVAMYRQSHQSPFHRQCQAFSGLRRPRVSAGWLASRGERHAQVPGTLDLPPPVPSSTAAAASGHPDR